MQTVFKAQSDKVPYSRNTRRMCVQCLADSEPGSPGFSLCSGCRSVRYCSREHQAAHWPLHKAFCKQQRIANQSLESSHSPTGSGIPPTPQRRRLIEDFVNLHLHSIEQAMASALHVEDRPFHFSKQCACFNLSYYPESGGNPSTAFILDSAYFLDNPPPNSPTAATFEGFRPLAEASDEEDRGQQGYLGLLICVYLIDDDLMWMSARPMFEYYLCKEITDHKKWLSRLKYSMHKGLVFRLREVPDKDKWRPGIMEQDGSRWVWKEKSIEELRAYDIHLSKGPAAD